MEHLEAHLRMLERLKQPSPHASAVTPKVRFALHSPNTFANQFGDAGFLHGESRLRDDEDAGDDADDAGGHR